MTFTQTKVAARGKHARCSDRQQSSCRMCTGMSNAMTCILICVYTYSHAFIQLVQPQTEFFVAFAFGTVRLVAVLGMQGRCDMACGAPCRRLPCNQRCPKLLPCGHRCPSLCGEPCPNRKFCIKCGHKDVTVSVRSADGFSLHASAQDYPRMSCQCMSLFFMQTLGLAWVLHICLPCLWLVNSSMVSPLGMC